MKYPAKSLSQSVGLKQLLKADGSYHKKYVELVRCTENMSSGDLQRAYLPEYTSWRNRKKIAKDNSIEWFQPMNAFRIFLKINGHIPHQHWTLDRIDPTGGYVPENLRWASKRTQTENRTNSRSVLIGQERLTIAEASRRYGKSYDAVRMGLNRSGSAYLDILIEPPKAISDLDLTVEQWEFPPNCEEVQKLYVRRINKQYKKPRFFVELVAYELKVRKEIVKTDASPDAVADAQKDIECLLPLLADTQAFIDRINRRRYVLNEQSKAPQKYQFIDIVLPPPPEWDLDYYLKDEGEYPWATYPKEIDPVDRTFWKTV